MRTTCKGEGARLRGQQQGRLHGLEYQSDTASGANAERVGTGRHATRHEREGQRAKGRACHLRLPDFSRGVRGREVLTQQAWPWSSSADTLNAERYARHQRERQRGAQNLATALAVGAINSEHTCLLRGLSIPHLFLQPPDFVAHAFPDVDALGGGSMALDVVPPGDWVNWI